jgi:DNA-binding transcriptional ArsR family regulator
VGKDLSDSSPRVGGNLDDILTGTTLRVYRFMISRGEGVGPRELQRSLRLSSPGVASFHLDKLLRAGLVSRSDDGLFAVDRVYLKHYIRVRRSLIPTYTFYAILTSGFLAGWIVLLSLPGRISRNSFWTAIHTNDSFILIATVSYGLVITVLVCGVFWYETVKVLRNDKI